MGVAFPANVPLCRVVIDQIATALDTATAKQWTGSGTAKPDHDRYRAPSVPGGTDGLYIDDKAVSFTIANGRGEFVAPASEIDGFTWTNVRYRVSLKVGDLTLPEKTLWLPRGTTSDGGATWMTPTIHFFAEDEDTGSGSPQAGPVLAQVLAALDGPRTPWAAGTAYPAGSHVTYGQAFWTATRDIPAATVFGGQAAGWWRTGYDADTI